MKKRTVTRIGCLLVAGLTAGLVMTASEKPAAAQEIQITGPLAGAPAVKKLRLRREGRAEIAPMVSFTLLDEYKRTILFGGRLQYHFWDWLGIGLWGGFGGVQTATDLTEQIDTAALRNSRTASNVSGQQGQGQFPRQVGEMQWVAGPQIQAVPFRGKLSLFQNIFVDTDAYFHGGLAFVGLQERQECGLQGQPLCRDAFNLVSRTAIAPTFGLGLNFYMSNFLSLGVEYRALPFSWNRSGFDSRGAGPNAKYPNGLAGNPIVNDEDRTFKFNQMISVALGISLPTKPRLSD